MVSGMTTVLPLIRIVHLGSPGIIEVPLIVRLKENGLWRCSLKRAGPHQGKLKMLKLWRWALTETPVTIGDGVLELGTSLANHCIYQSAVLAAVQWKARNGAPSRSWVRSVGCGRGQRRQCRRARYADGRVTIRPTRATISSCERDIGRIQLSCNLARRPHAKVIVRRPTQRKKL